MGREDLEAVLVIEAASFSRPWTRRHFLDEIESQHGLPVVAVAEDGALAGYLCLKLVLDEGEILDVAVDPAFRRRGIARLLVEHAQALCRERNAAYLGLEVRVGNHAAQSVYRTLGFRESGRRRGYYDDGEDAVLMACAL